MIGRAIAFASAFAAVVAASGCGDAGVAGPPERIAVLEADVFATSCAFTSCHGTVTPRMGLSLVAPVHAAVVGQPSTEVPGRMRVVPGDPAASYLFEKISSDKPAVGARMPPGQPLPAAVIQSVRRWIESGAAAD